MKESDSKERGSTAVLEPPTSCTLDAYTDISGAVKLRELFAQLIGAGQPITLDGSAVEKIDTAALQLIAALRRDLADRGRTLTWTNASDVVRRAAKSVGLSAAIGLTD